MTLIFVYNADTGLFNTLTDAAHKLLSPETYACNLCAITHSHLGMRDPWRQFIESLGVDIEFLHRDEWINKYGERDIPLPAVFRMQDDAPPALAPELIIDAKTINKISSLDELKALVKALLREQV